MGVKTLISNWIGSSTSSTFCTTRSRQSSARMTGKSWCNPLPWFCLIPFWPQKTGNNNNKNRLTFFKTDGRQTSEMVTVILASSLPKD